MRRSGGRVLRRIGLALVCLAVLPLPGLLRFSLDLEAERGTPGWTRLYQREGGTHKQTPFSAELLFVGDVMLGRGVLGQDQPFKHVSRLLTLPDLAVGNFEGSLADRTGSRAAKWPITQRRPSVSSRRALPPRA